ncbi:MAG: hypothetical protein AAF907_01270 [Planctomycetota bacterium]
MRSAFASALVRSTSVFSIGLLGLILTGCGGVQSGAIEPEEKTDAEIQAEFEMNERMAAEAAGGLGD